MVNIFVIKIASSLRIFIGYHSQKWNDWVRVILLKHNFYKKLFYIKKILVSRMFLFFVRVEWILKSYKLIVILLIPTISLGKKDPVILFFSTLVFDIFQTFKSIFRARGWMFGNSGVIHTRSWVLNVSRIWHIRNLGLPWSPVMIAIA